jgi:hypothetical protein
LPIDLKDRKEELLWIHKTWTLTEILHHSWKS